MSKEKKQPYRNTLLILKVAFDIVVNTLTTVTRGKENVKIE